MGGETQSDLSVKRERNYEGYGTPVKAAARSCGFDKQRRLRRVVLLATLSAGSSLLSKQRGFTRRVVTGGESQRAIESSRHGGCGEPNFRDHSRAQGRLQFEGEKGGAHRADRSGNL